MPRGASLKTKSRARAVNVFLLPAQGNKFDVNEAGLIGLTFDRYINNPDLENTGIIQKLDITMMSRTSNELAAYIASNNSNLRLQYGFDDNLSRVYDLKVIQLKTRRTDNGIGLAIGAIGMEQQQIFQPELFKQGVKIKDILEEIADRNGWDADIDCDLQLPKPLLKEENQTDIDFIRNKIIPIANQSIMQSSRDKTVTTFWDFRIFKEGVSMTLSFKPRNSNIRNRRIWDYSLGTSDQTHVVSATQDLNMSHLINGLTIRVSSNLLEQSAYTEESLREAVLEMKDDLQEKIKNIHDRYNIPMLGVDNFDWKIELVESDNTDEDVLNELEYDSLRVRIISAIDKAVQALNTIELEVIGNPEILPTDLIRLLVMNPDGNYDWLTSPGGLGSYWKVVGIQENIGLDGYKTKLNLVREYIID